MKGERGERIPSFINCKAKCNYIIYIIRVDIKGVRGYN